MNEDNFFSINRLVEFGLGMAVAQQMVNKMNSAISNMHVAGSMNPIQTSSPTFYFVIMDGNQAGPFAEQEITRLISDKKIDKETYIWKPGMSKWELSENIPEILKLVALMPPPFQKNA